MHRWMAIAAVGVGTVLFARLAGSAAGGEAPSAASAAAPFTAKEQQTFDELYKPRIDQAASRAAKAALGKELLTQAGSVEGGLRYLLLAAAKDLATEGAELEAAIQAAEQIAAMDRGDRKAQLAELLDLQLKHFYALGRRPVAAKDRLEMQKALHALGSRIVDNALTLGGLHRAAAAFEAAAEAEKLALRPATLISSGQLGELKQAILISQTLKELADQARRDINLDRIPQAQWGYIDAGLYDEAAKLKCEQADETAELLLRVATAAAPRPAELFEAAKAWDQRAVEAKGALQQIRLLRAADLYQRYMAASDAADRNVAKLRLQAIEQKLGDLMCALRGPAEWTSLVDLREESASVGWGSFGKITVDKGPIGIAGKQFATGLKVHASSKVVYSLRGRYRELSIHYGLLTGAGGVASFHVVCDGKKAFDSEWMWSNSGKGVSRPTVVNLAGVDRLELITTAHRGGAGAFSAWGDPKVR